MLPASSFMPAPMWLEVNDRKLELRMLGPSMVDCLGGLGIPPMVLSWMLELSKLATPPWTWMPPPCKPKSGARNIPLG